MSAHVPEPNALGIPSEHQAQYDECVKIAKALEGIRRARANSGKVIDAVSDIKGFLKLNWTQITLQSLSDISGQIQSTIADLRRGVRNSTAEILESLPSSTKLFALIREDPAQNLSRIRLPRSMLDQALHRVYPTLTKSAVFKMMRDDIKRHPVLYDQWRDRPVAQRMEIVEKVDNLAGQLEARKELIELRSEIKRTGAGEERKAKYPPLPVINPITPTVLLGETTESSQVSSLLPMEDFAEADAMPSPFNLQVRRPDTPRTQVYTRPHSLVDAHYAHPARKRPHSPEDAFHANRRSGPFRSSSTANGNQQSKYHPVDRESSADPPLKGPDCPHISIPNSP
ncbi:hypothetical protein JCM16303_003962 [Sporobolomyces ruberrimus]